MERIDVGGSDGSEVPMVQGRDRGQLEAFGDGDGGRVDDIEVQVGVGDDQLMSPNPIST